MKFSKSIIVGLLVGTISAQEGPSPQEYWNRVEDQARGMTGDEFYNGYREADPNAGDDEIMGTFYHLDWDQSGTLSHDEFFSLFGDHDAHHEEREHERERNTDIPPPEHFWDQVRDQAHGMSADEFMAGFRSVDPEATDENIWGAFQHADWDQSNTLSHDEFFSFYWEAVSQGGEDHDDHHEGRPEMPSPDELWQWFAQEDGMTGDGFMQMVHALEEGGEVDEEEAMEYFYGFDHDQSGMIDRDEFQQMYDYRMQKLMEEHHGGHGGEHGGDFHNQIGEYINHLGDIVEMEIQRRVQEEIERHMSSCLEWGMGDGEGLRMTEETIHEMPRMEENNFEGRVMEGEPRGGRGGRGGERGGEMGDSSTGGRGGRGEQGGQGGRSSGGRGGRGGRN